MTALVVALTLHVACWGAVGAAIGPRAGLRGWAGASLSILLPVVAAAVLAVLAVLPRTTRPQPRASRRWRAACWTGVAAGGLVAVSAWLPWVEVVVQGRVGSVRDHLVALNSQNWQVLPILGTAVGVVVALFAGLAMRDGRREWLAGGALAGWIPAAVGAAALLTEDLVNALLRHVNALGDVLAEQGVDELGVAGQYVLGPGPMLALAGGAAALVWALAGALVRSTAAPVADPVAAQSGHLAGPVVVPGLPAASHDSVIPQTAIGWPLGAGDRLEPGEPSGTFLPTGDWAPADGPAPSNPEWDSPILGGAWPVADWSSTGETGQGGAGRPW